MLVISANSAAFTYYANGDRAKAFDECGKRTAYRYDGNMAIWQYGNVIEMRHPTGTAKAGLRALEKRWGRIGAH